MNPNSEMTPKEKKAVDELRSRIPDVLPTLRSDFHRMDLNLLRFIRARELNVTKAEDMLRKSYAYRESKDMENILEVKISANIPRDFFVCVAGRDKAGFVVGLTSPGSWEIRKNFAAGLREELMTYGLQCFEMGMRLSEKLSSPDKFQFQFYVIIDLHGFRLREIATKEIVETAIELTRIFESCCPEILRAVVVINVPVFWEIIWKFIRPVLTPRTLSKITIFGCNNTKWKAHLLRDIDPDQLPSICGGAITYCPSAWPRRQNLDVFPKFHVFPRDEFSSVTVNPRENMVVEVLIDHIGTNIAWNFKTKDYDIAFQLDFRAADGAEEDWEIANIRVDSHLFLQKGLYVCEKTGIYSLIFDNSYSKMTTKELDYIVRICGADNPISEDDSWKPPKLA